MCSWTTTTAYTIFGWFELAAWLADAKLIIADSVKLFRWSTEAIELLCRSDVDIRYCIFNIQVLSLPLVYCAGSEYREAGASSQPERLQQCWFCL